MAALAYGPRFDEAMGLTLEAFRGVYRKGRSIPYLTHLLAVTALVGEYGGDEDQLIAALLHDYLEDIEGASVVDLTNRFGPRVAGLVELLSDTQVVKPKPPWRPRKEAHLRRLATAPAEAKLVAAADKLHNCQTLRQDLLTDGPAVFERFTGGFEGTLWYYREAAAALGRGWAHPLWERLRREVEELEREARR
jgi:(p)ppGpp synthase/HD superfamily hydrolase